MLRGWTLYQGALSFLDSPDAQPGDYVEPTGINACGQYRHAARAVGDGSRSPTGTTCNRGGSGADRDGGRPPSRPTPLSSQPAAI
ncbi:MAG: hypothetical protein AB1461_10545 [Thermodesulfobacteriota bacterium]